MKNTPVAAGALCALLSSFAFAAPPVVLDGTFEEWATIAPAITDPADAAGAEIDIGAIRTTSDGSSLYFLLDIGVVRNLQALDGKLHLIIDADHNLRTGSTAFGLDGTDVVVTFPGPPRYGKGGMGVGIQRPGHDKTGSPYELGLAIAPAHADKQIEVSIDRAAANGLFSGRRARARLVALDKSGTVRDETEAFDIDMVPFAAPSPPDDTADPLHLRDQTLRVMSWNGEHGALLSKPSEAIRLIRAAQPDVILLQELSNKNTPAELRQLFAQAQPDVDWQVQIGAGGGNLRCAIVSRYPMKPHRDLEPIAYPGQRNRSLRATGATIEVDGRNLLVISLHLKCCGRIGDSADRKRIVETNTIHAALRTAIERGGVDGVVIAGDFNLVGARTPLEIMSGDADIDGSELLVVPTLQLDGGTNATWRDPGQPFSPGRLDYCLISDRSLELHRSFAFDTRDLSPRWLKHHNLQLTDTDLSDHLPLLVDVSWR